MANPYAHAGALDACVSGAAATDGADVVLRPQACARAAKDTIRRVGRMTGFRRGVEGKCVVQCATACVGLKYGGSRKVQVAEPA